ncbi:NifU family protein [Corallococcus sp. H22C18031201]|uniref:NifU family protein n=1 Tax=Citreicoccus inhibens TaxID=2849499 RepID=UPI000E71DA9D|nr:NifU family protein [Citreicoccus inhibens]MBU8896228.1 NifU family protein [Citreicoccus inhibens]RJS26092.1 NifU family protein [Corallococcus sp. H22C18031201]
MSVNIQLEWTPNPSTLKYVVDRRLLGSGAVNITSKDDAQAKSPLARKLMDIRGVMAVMVGTNFVTVTKGDEGEWDELNDSVMATLDSHLEANEPVVDEAAVAAARQQSTGDGSVVSRIQDILDSEIRPAVAQDGGDITLDRFEDGVVYLHMKGSCAGCPSSTATLKMGIESRLREIIPEVNEVVSV